MEIVSAIMRVLIVLVLFLVSVVSRSQYDKVEIGILQQTPIHSMLLQAKVGSYKILADGKEFLLKPEDALRLRSVGNEVVARTMQNEIRSKTGIHLIPRSDVSRIRIRSTKVDVAARTYQGTFSIKPSIKGLECSVLVPLEDYVSGVVQSESGKGRHLEYYKLQSIICRTYALKNINKHAHEGFNLCDQTHCQVYKGASDYERISSSSHATKGQVLVDSAIEFVDATFHANCGGQTMNSEDVWSKEVSYLRSIPDKYCLKADHSTWSKSLAQSEWLGYLNKSFQVDINEPSVRNICLNYEPECRDVYFANITPLVSLEKVRKDLGLKSTYFSVKSTGKTVELRGKGFGHGVGMCQEGAMVMALTDRTFKQILHHYYSDVHIVDIGAMDFFRDDEADASRLQEMILEFGLGMR